MVAVATAELLDAIGSLHTAAAALEGQLAEIQRNLESDDPRISHVKSKLKTERVALEAAIEMVGKWGAQVGPYTAAMPRGPADFDRWCGGLPLAATDPSAPKLALTDLTVQRVIGVCVLSRDPRVQTTLAVFNSRRSIETKRIVPIILNDVRAYTHSLQAVLAAPGELAASEALRRIESAHVPQMLGGAKLTTKQVAALTGLDRVPDRNSLSFAVQKRMEATAGSITLYRLVCGIVEGVELPGGVPFVVPGARSARDAQCCLVLSSVTSSRFPITTHTHTHVIQVV